MDINPILDPFSHIQLGKIPILMTQNSVPPKKTRFLPVFFTIVLSLNHRVFTQSIDHVSKTPQEDVDLLGVVLGTTRSAISILVEPLAPYRSEALLGYGSITMVYNSNNYGLWYL